MSERGVPLLRLEGVRSGYGAIEALKGVDVEIYPGEIVTLIGANGAGKTTLLNTVCGIVAVRGGQVSMEGTDITAAPTPAIVRRGLVQVPEGRRLFPEMTVEENLEMGAFLRRDKKAIGEDFERVYELFPRLSERRKQLAGSLSGGEQQMCAIGRALMARPRILLLDEPSLGLAPLLVKQIFETIAQLNAGGTTIFLVEQNAYAALRLAHRGYVMETGRIVMSGPAADLLTDDRVREAYLGH